MLDVVCPLQQQACFCRMSNVVQACTHMLFSAGQVSVGCSFGASPGARQR